MPPIIKFPQPSKTAYKPNRSLEKNHLIKAQVKHFYEAEQHLPKNLRTGKRLAEIRTEGQAAAYVEQVTIALHKAGGITPQKVRTPR